MKDYKILSKLGTGLSIIDSKNEIPTVGSLVNHKQGKRKRKGTPATSPLEILGMNIGYVQSDSPGGYKHVLVLVDKCTSNTFLMVCMVYLERTLLKLFGNFSSTPVGSHALSNATLILDLLVGKQYCSYGLTAVTYVLHPLIDKIIMV